MFTEIKVMPKGKVPDFQPGVPFAIVQISTKDGEHPPYQKENCVAAFQTTFPDLDLPRQMEGMFDGEKARAILDFVESIKDKIDVLAIHCEAGLSRSPAIAGALSKHYFESDTYFFDPPYCPNMLVYRCMMNAIVERYKCQ